MIVSWDDVAELANMKATAGALSKVGADVSAILRSFWFVNPQFLADYAGLYPILHLLAKRFHPNRYLEIGVLRAYSSVVVTTGWPAVDIVAVDSWVDPKALSPRDARRRITNGGHSGYLSILSGDSGKLVGPYLGTFDLILVDGDHLAEAMTADLDNCAPLLAPGGHLIMHDVFSPHAPHGTAIWNAFKQAHPRWEWLEHRPTPGVGVGRRPL